MRIEQARVVNHVPYSGEYRLLELNCAGIAAAVQPGQFVHLHIPRLDSAVLRRPFSVFKAGAGTITILYKRVGRGTEAMTRLAPEDALDLIGPLGNGFPLEPRGMPVLVAGGYGVAPLFFLAERLHVKGTLLVGAAKAADVLCAAEFRQLGWDVQIATDDGSLGTKGFITTALDAWLAQRRQSDVPEFFACGPDGMLKAVGEKAIANGCRAWLSLDKHMGCGVGACLACVQKIRKNDGSAVWARVCREGPVFEARQVVWKEKS
jgi:dihydroorotate dehydrogenase electron transfer subunit